MNKRMRKTVITLTVMILTVGVIIGQEKMDHKKMGDSTNKSCCASKNNDSGSCMAKNNSMDMQSVDVKTIDKNKDGKVFQCQMCPQQIADEPGKCPDCEMGMIEVSIDDAQKSTEQKSHKMMDHMKKDVHKMDHSEMMKDGEHKMKNSMVHEGIIDVSAIDKNGDKKVFQDQMDWNVISDKPGTCPLCEMSLKEVSIYEAKTNLITNGFKVK